MKYILENTLSKWILKFGGRDDIYFIEYLNVYGRDAVEGFDNLV
jgi:hypothetical protein